MTRPNAATDAAALIEALREARPHVEFAFAWKRGAYQVKAKAALAKIDAALKLAGGDAVINLDKLIPAKPRPLWITGEIIEHGTGRFVATAEWQVTDQGKPTERGEWVYKFDQIKGTDNAD